ncbi:MAG TPA: phosphoribosyltransferase family protein [Longimicrobiaceae bacterium]|nr:phosphoribosyltransferase family protein [Longimicrobiaceae bacterium]
MAAALSAYAGTADTLVLGIVRGGIPGAAEVARHLGLPLDVLLIRRLLAPRGADSPVCAVSAAGNLLLDAEATGPQPDAGQAAFLADALAAFAERVHTCRGERAALDLSGKTVILFDNGAHTGGTMRIALRFLRRLAPARVIAAVPVSSVVARDELLAAADEVVCLATPEPFGHVGMWHADYRVPQVEEVRSYLAGS